METGADPHLFRSSPRSGVAALLALYVQVRWLRARPMAIFFAPGLNAVRWTPGTPWSYACIVMALFESSKHSATLMCSSPPLLLDMVLRLLRQALGLRDVSPA